MKQKTCLLLVVALVFLAFPSCSKRGPSGAMGAWVAGRGILIRVTPKTVRDGRELPAVDFDNQSEGGFNIYPQKCFAWYEKSGLHQVTWEERDRNIEVAPHASFTGGLPIDLQPPVGDKLLKVRLEFGPGPDETFTFVRK